MERVAKTPKLEFLLDIETSKNCELIKVFLSMNSGWISNETIFFLNLLTLIFQSKPIHSLTMKSGLFFHNLFFFLSSLLLCHLKLFKLSCLFLKTEKSYIFFPKVNKCQLINLILLKNFLLISPQMA